ncbi:hypothetical protein CC78DRAFT_581587 [Lojkania enalia]|uniref:Uncharacterized protein n=1 Tax=Lojkania enalia TaxID=147567 RepID=A0A9P4N7Z0_9PLEO|nr:hypothetical protein CC78DRAFT_581587 [Didymosphaeria enalia]
MWILFRHAPVSIALLAVALVPSITAKPYPPSEDEKLALRNATQLKARDCGGGTACGYYNQLCCYNGDSCYTDANNQAQCGPVTAAATGGWVYYTSTWVETNFVTRTAVYSSFVGGPVPAAPTESCDGARSPCGSGCCDSGYYCADFASGTCQLLGGGTSGGIGTLTPSAPLRPTSSTLIIITATGSPTVTQPFETPIPTGVSPTPLPADGGGGGLSGGAIAGIVIGVILGIILLLLLCLFCCARALFDTVMAIFGLGKKRRHTHEETTYIEEHHHSGGGGRRWYGQGPARPSGPKKSGRLGNMLGIGAVLGGLALALGLKRRHDRKHDDKSTTISSDYYSGYYTSSSTVPPLLENVLFANNLLGSASSDDRRTRHTRHSSRH